MRAEARTTENATEQSAAATPAQLAVPLRAALDKYDRWFRDPFASRPAAMAYDLATAIRAALAVEAVRPETDIDESLDAAWREAEAALPEGGRLHLQRRAEAAPEVQPSGEVWIARQGRAAGAYEAWATTSAKSLGFAYDETPIAALRALTERLRAK